MNCASPSLKLAEFPASPANKRWLRQAELFYRGLHCLRLPHDFAA
jgi:hypothetical protein